jgi:chromosome segregation ATPase
VTAISVQKQNPDLPNEVFAELLAYFYTRLESEKGNKGQKFLREIELFVEDIINEPDFNLEATIGKLKSFLSDKSALEREVTLQFCFDKVVNKVFRKAAVVFADQHKHFKYELEEKEKDIEAEKEKKKMVNKLLAEQKSTIADYQSKIQQLESTIKTKAGEISDLRRADNSEQALLNQLALNREKIERLENELRLSNERAVGSTKLGDMKASVFLGNIGDNAQFLNADSQDLRDFLEYLKDEMLRENTELRTKLELASEEVDRLKCNNLDTAEKDEEIADLRLKLEKLEKTKNSNEYEAHFARVSFDNAQLKANQEYYLNVVREILKVTKKQKNQLKNALGLLNEQDAATVINMMKEFKMSY